MRMPLVRALAILFVFSGPALAQLPPDPTTAADLFVPWWPGLVAEDVCLADTFSTDPPNHLVCDFGPFPGTSHLLDPLLGLGDDGLELGVGDCVLPYRLLFSAASNSASRSSYSARRAVSSGIRDKLFFCVSIAFAVSPVRW